MPSLLNDPPHSSGYRVRRADLWLFLRVSTDYPRASASMLWSHALSGMGVSLASLRDFPSPRSRRHAYPRAIANLPECKATPAGRGSRGPLGPQCWRLSDDHTVEANNLELAIC